MTRGLRGAEQVLRNEWLAWGVREAARQGKEALLVSFKRYEQEMQAVKDSSG